MLSIHLLAHLINANMLWIVILLSLSPKFATKLSNNSGIHIDKDFIGI